MEYQYIVNPETNRRVSLDGRLGRRILRNYLAQWQRGGATTNFASIGDKHPNCEFTGEIEGEKVTVTSITQPEGETSCKNNSGVQYVTKGKKSTLVKPDTDGVDYDIDGVPFTAY